MASRLHFTLLLLFYVSFSWCRGRGGSRISGMGVHVYKGVGGFALLILSHFS